MKSFLQKIKTKAGQYGPAEWLAFTAFGLLLLWLFWTALRLRLEYFDNYTVLTNARAIAWFQPEQYYWKRFILLPVLLCPFFWLQNAFFADPFAFVASHCFAVALFALLLWVFYRLVRLYERPRSLALIATALLASNRLLIHFAPFVKEDIPAALLVTAGFYFYTRAQKKPRLRENLLASASWGAAIAMRYNLIPPVFLVLALLEAAALRRLFRDGARPEKIFREALQRVFFSLVLPCALFFLIPAVLYDYLGFVSFSRGPEKIIHEILLIRELNMKPEPPEQNFFFLGLSMTWPLFSAAAAGAVYSCKRRKPEALLLASWAAVFFLYHTFFICNKEARYLFPMLPPLYFFAALAFDAAQRKIKGAVKGEGQKLCLACAAIVVCAWPLKNAIAECRRFLHPVYAADYAGGISKAAMELAGKTGTIFWAGKMYALHDSDYIFHPEDEVTYIYHIFNHTIGYYTNRFIQGFINPDYVVARDHQTQRLWVFPTGLGEKVKDGDVLVMSLEENGYNTKTLPKTLRPMVVARARTLDLSALPQEAQGKTIFVSAVQPSLRLSIAAPAPGSAYTLEGTGLPAGLYEIYLVTKSGERRWQGIADAASSGFKLRMKAKEPMNAAGILILTYDRTLFFPHPGEKLPEKPKG